MQTETITLFHGEALFRAGQPATDFYLVQRGSIVVVDQAGVRTCRQFGADELFGLPEVLAQSCWDLTAIASGLTRKSACFPPRRFSSHCLTCQKAMKNS